MPECVDPEYEGEPCPLAGLELWPANYPAWEAYSRVGNIVQQNFAGFPLLDLPGVISKLEKTGWGPDSPEGWDELLTSLEIIHQARAEAHEAARDDGKKQT